MTTAFRPAAPTVPSSAPEQLLDARYRLLDRLGSGGAADVWRAHDTRLERAVAIKIFRPGATDPARERAEAEFMARCSHRGLVTVYDVGSLESRYEAPRSYLVMELVEGPTLRERLRTGPLPRGTVAAIGAQVAGALAYVHAQGVVHRDVKPANLLVSDAPGDEPVVKLADFGVARMLGSEHLTEVGTTVGTANYVSPEQIRGAAVGPASDVYSLGLVLLEALTGQMSYPGRGVEAAIARLERRPELPPGLGPEFGALLAAMTADDPDSRPSAAEVAGRLSLVAGVPDDAVTTALRPAPHGTLGAGLPAAVAPAALAASAAAVLAAGGESGAAARSRRGLVLAAAATVAALLGGVGLAVGSSDGGVAPRRDPAAASSPVGAPVANAPSSSARASSAPATRPASTAVTAQATRTAPVESAQVVRAPAAAGPKSKTHPHPGGPRQGKHPAGEHPGGKLKH